MIRALRYLATASLLAVLLWLPAWAATPDPAGTATGTAADVIGATAGAPSADDMKTLGEKEPLAVKLADVVGHNRIAINFVWTLVSGFLVMFMQAGFAMVETGFTRAKNAGHTMAMNFMVYALGHARLLGLRLRHPDGRRRRRRDARRRTAALDQRIHDHTSSARTSASSARRASSSPGCPTTPSVFALFLFQMVFMDTTATIPTGAMAERWNFKSFMVYGFFISACSSTRSTATGSGAAAGSSQLGKNFGLGHGHVDFAGSSVVHMIGGVVRPCGCDGPRAAHRQVQQGRHAERRSPATTSRWRCSARFILAFGWFGFNPGSTLAGTDLRIGVVATNTMLAGAAAAFVVDDLHVDSLRQARPSHDVQRHARGPRGDHRALRLREPASPRSSSAPSPASSSVVSVFFVERTLKIDDPVGAISVHGVNGAWGVLSLGLFADGTYGDGWNGVAGTVKGLFYGDGFAAHGAGASGR